jgi:hypothetical protein
MIINSISYQNLRYENLPPQDYVWGNIGDVVRLELEIQLQTAGAGFIEIYYNLIPNSQNPYATPLSFAIDNSVFKNLHTQAIQVFKGNLPTIDTQILLLTPSNPNNFFEGVFQVEAINVASRIYKFIATYSIIPYVREIDIDTTSNTFKIPSYFGGNESLKGVFKINSKVTEINPTIIETSETINCSAFFKQGNIGYLNEKLNGLSANYSLVANSVAWQNGLTNIDSSQISTVRFQIKKGSGNFVSTTSIFVRTTTPNDTFNTQNYHTSQNYDLALLGANGAAANGLFGKLISCTATINADDASLLDCQVSFGVNTYGSNVAMWLNIANDVTTTNFANYDSNNVWVLFAEPTPQLNDPVQLQRLGNANGRISFLYHYDNNPSAQSFNHVNAGFVLDWFQALTKIVPQNGAIVEQIQLQVKRTNGAVLDSIVNTTPDLLPVNFERPFNLLAGDYRQQVSVINAANEYEVRAAFKIQPAWFSFQDVVFAVLVNGSQNGLPFNIEFRSPAFRMQTYELSLNDDTEPKALGYVGSKKIFVDGNEVSKIIKGKKNVIRFYFRDTNLNDLEATIDQLVGYFTVNFANEPFATQYSIHSEWHKNPASPWEETTGHTAGRVKIEIIAINEATIEAVLDAEKLVSIFGEQRQYAICGRLDKKNPPQYIERVLLHLRGNNLGNRNFRPFMSFTESIDDFEVKDVLGAIVTNSFLYKYSEAINPNWAILPSLTKVQLLQAISLGSGIYKVQVVPTIQALYTEATLIFEYIKSGLIPPQTWSYNFANTVSSDTLLGFDAKINIISITGAGALSYWKIRENNLTDWNSINGSLLSNISALNAAILATTGNYELQIINYNQSNITFNYTYL